MHACIYIIVLTGEFFSGLENFGIIQFIVRCDHMLCVLMCDHSSF